MAAAAGISGKEGEGERDRGSCRSRDRDERGLGLRFSKKGGVGEIGRAHV